jgi:HD superfamily phosphohydrolase
MADTSFSLKDIEAIAEAFSTQHLARYVEDIKSPERTFARKEINDALWGTIALTPVEVALLDSPLIQRLRSIRQLGVVHWVYPGAVHTRFEHTLGVLHQVQHLISALNALGVQRDQPQLISATLVQLLRLCALVHDVGHAAFSHVSEMALESLPEINPISAEFSRRYRAEGRSLSEIFAFYIVRSKAMRALFNALLDRYGDFVSMAPDRHAIWNLLSRRSDMRSSVRR